MHIQPNIINFKTLDSTNTYAKKNIETLADKTIVSTNIQTKGYGRFDRTWVDLGEGNIYMTMVLKPSEAFSEVYSNLTQYLSVCLCKHLEEMGMEPQIKWPNDVLLNGKKVCGILAESVFRGGKLKGIVLGIGVNLNANLENLNEIDRPATSVNIELGQTVNKQDFMQKILEKFFADYDEFLEKGFVYIKEDYEKRSVLVKGKRKRGKAKEDNINNVPSSPSPISKSPLEYFLPTGGGGSSPIKVAVFNKIKQGVFNGFDDDGTLLLLMPDGIIEKINMGEII